ncbi:uncharacterized protein LOC117170177 isoform X2 [Belonocnema kinseyi]|nr:uncharacterized protein LOC117170177 isoform X2 [Belonocnema kinseyi]
MKMHVQLDAPHYVKLHTDVNLTCNHNVSDSNLRKVEFLRDNTKILQYIRDRSPPFRISVHNLEYTPDGKTITLKKVGFPASGLYSCEVSTVSPIYEEESPRVKMEVIVPQTEDPVINVDKSIYLMGEYLNANCSSSPAHPAPHLTWLINEKEVDLQYVNYNPHQRHKDLMSSSVQLKIKLSELHSSENGQLEIRCDGTIPDYHQHKHYADVRSKTVTVQVMPAPVISSSSKNLGEELTLLIISSVFCSVHKMIPL